MTLKLFAVWKTPIPMTLRLFFGDVFPLPLPILVVPAIEDDVDKC